MNSSPTLEVLVATYNRCDLLRSCLGSFLEARPPGAMDWRVTVVDNNSTDSTRATVDEFVQREPSRIRYHFEARPGKSAALNSGILASDRDIVAFIDDDERIAADWLVVMERSFSDPTLDYLGGPYLGLWSAPKPDWCPVPGFEGVISVDEPDRIPSTIVSFQSRTDLFLRGGNSAFRRSVFDRVGLLNVDLGRFATGLGSCEDEDLFRRVQAAGLHGRYDPSFAVWHHVPPSRLTRSYHRRWARDQAASLARLERQCPATVARIGRLPRWMIGRTLGGLRRLTDSDPGERFAVELRCWSLLGYFLGAYGLR